MNSVRVLCIYIFLFTYSSNETSAKPFAPLIAFKKGLMAGLLKGYFLKENVATDTPRRSFRGTASGKVEFSGQITPKGTSNYQTQRMYGLPFWNSGQLQLSGSLHASHKQYPTFSENGRTTRRRTLAGNLTFNANVTPNVFRNVVPITVPPTTYVATVINNRPSSNAATAGAVYATSVAPMPNGYSAAEANVVRSSNGMQYGMGNININVANAGSGTGAFIHLGGGSTAVTNIIPISPAITEPVDNFSTLNTDSNLDTYLPPSDSYLPPTEHVFVSSDYDIGSDTIFSDGFVADTTYGTTDTDLSPTTDIDSTSNYDNDYDSVAPDTYSDYSSIDYGVMGSGYESSSTTESNFGLNVDFSVSGSGSISNTDSVKAEANANFDASFSAYGSGDTTVDSPDYITSGSVNIFTAGDVSSNDYYDMNGLVVDNTSTDSKLETYVPPNDAYLPPNDAYLPPVDDVITSPDYNLPRVDGTVMDDTLYDIDNNNNEFQVQVSGSSSGTTPVLGEPSISTSGPFTNSYDSYIKTNIEALKTLSDIALLHGTGLPVTIRLRTRHRVRQRPQGTSGIVSVRAGEQSTAGTGILNLFTDGSKFEISKAPLLLKYSDVIESPDAVPTALPVSYTSNAVEVSDSDSSNRLSASGSLNVNFNVNAGFNDGRSIIGGRMRIESPNLSQSRQMHPSPRSQSQQNIAKVIPKRANSDNTIQQNIRNIQHNFRRQAKEEQRRTPIIKDHNRRNNAQTERNFNRPTLQMKNNVRSLPSPISPSQMKNNVRSLPIRRTLPVVKNNSRSLPSQRITQQNRNNMRSPSIRMNPPHVKNNVQFSSLRMIPLQKKNKAQSQSSRVFPLQMRNRKGKTETSNGAVPQRNQNRQKSQNNNPPHQSQRIAVSSSRNSQRSFIDILAQFAEAHRLSLLENTSQSTNVRSSSSAVLNRGKSIANSNSSNGSQSRSNQGRSPSSNSRREISSLDRKENSGISRAKLRLTYRDTIPSPEESLLSRSHTL